MAKKWRTDSERQAYYLSKTVDRAVREHNMIENGDKILVAVSGGKDSMSLLRLLNYRSKYSPVHYDLFAGFIKGDARGNVVEIPNSFMRWIESEGVPFYIWDIITTDNEALPMDCERCGRNRRRTLFEMADKLGCNKVALGHNLEDFSQTALLNLFHSGKLETMAFKRTYFGGRFTIIRPLAYMRENDIIRFAKACKFPIIQSDCPKSATSHRKLAGDLMKQVSRQFRQANVNIVKAACKDK